MKYLLYFILLVVAIACGFIYAKENRLIRLPSPAYLACGCGGCCKNAQPVPQCLYHLNGDSLEEIIKKDKESATSEDCYKECSQGIEYQYCD